MWPKPMVRGRSSDGIVASRRGGGMDNGTGTNEPAP